MRVSRQDALDRAKAVAATQSAIHNCEFAVLDRWASHGTFTVKRTTRVADVEQRDVIVYVDQTPTGDQFAGSARC